MVFGNSPDIIEKGVILQMNIFSGYELLWLFFVYSFLGWVLAVLVFDDLCDSDGVGWRPPD